MCIAAAMQGYLSQARRQVALRFLFAQDVCMASHVAGAIAAAAVSLEVCVCPFTR